MPDYYLPYVITEIYCFIFALIVLVRIDRNVGSEHEVRELRNMIYTYFVLIVTDILWMSFETDVLNPNNYLNALVNAISIMSISLGCYYWYGFVSDRLHRVFKRRKLHKILIRIPLLVIFALDLISVFTGWIFKIDTNGHYHETKLFILQGVVNYFYMIVPAFLAIKAAIKTRVVAERLECLSYTAYLFISLISVLFDTELNVGPILVLNIFMAIIILFLMIQNMRIYSDALTGLNNRRRLNAYLSDRLSKASDEHKIIIFMMDINNFKSINDEYGHIAGDAALKQFAQVMKCLAGQFGAFIARYGGDEFCLVCDLVDHKSPEEFDRELTQELDARLGEITNLTNGKKLSVSIGYTVCDEHEDYALAFMHADRMLYDRKKEWKIANANAR